MNNNNPFRLLTADEIEVKMADDSYYLTGKSHWVLYTKVRAAEELLDERYGPMNWDNDYYSLDGKIYCRITGRIGDQVTSKSDAGSSAKTKWEPTKSEATDAFKRAARRHGIARELATAPDIYIPDENLRFVERDAPDGSSYRYCQDKIAVREIEYDDNRRIKRLVLISTTSDKIVYSFGVTNEQAPDADTYVDFDEGFSPELASMANIVSAQPEEGKSPKCEKDSVTVESKNSEPTDEPEPPATADEENKELSESGTSKPAESGESNVSAETEAKTVDEPEDGKTVPAEAEDTGEIKSDKSNDEDEVDSVGNPSGDSTEVPEESSKKIPGGDIPEESALFDEESGSDEEPAEKDKGGEDEDIADEDDEPTDEELKEIEQEIEQEGEEGTNAETASDTQKPAKKSSRSSKRKVSGVDSSAYLGLFGLDSDQASRDENRMVERYFDESKPNLVDAEAYDPETEGQLLIEWGPTRRSKEKLCELDLDSDRGVMALGYLAIQFNPTKELGDKANALHVAAAKLWNSLPAEKRKVGMKLLNI